MSKPSGPSRDASTVRPAAPRRYRRILRHIVSRAAARWILIGALGALLVLLVGLIAVQGLRTGFSAMQLLAATLFVLPIAGALIGLLWYGRTLGGAVAGRTSPWRFQSGSTPWAISMSSQAWCATSRTGSGPRRPSRSPRRNSGGWWPPLRTESLSSTRKAAFWT